MGFKSWEGYGDSELLRFAQAGEAEAFGALYERYVSKTYRFIYAHIYDRLDAEDLTEEVFLRAWRSIPKYQDMGVPFGAFLLRIGRNVVVDHHRKNGRFGNVSSIDDSEPHDITFDTHEIVNNKLEIQELKYILDQVREDYRTVLVLRYLSGFSPEETAQFMDRSVGAVRVLQHRALEAVRKILETKTERKNGHKKG